MTIIVLMIQRYSEIEDWTVPKSPLSIGQTLRVAPTALRSLVAQDSEVYQEICGFPFEIA